MSGIRQLAVLVGICLTLTGCASAPGGQAPPTPASPTTAAPTPTPTPTSSTPTSTPTPAPTPTPKQVVTITLDGLTRGGGGGGDTVAFDAGDELVDFVGVLAGSEPSVSDIEDPWGGGEVWGTRSEWDGIGVSLYDGSANVVIRTPEVGGARVQTAEAIAVGSTRAESMAAGAWAVADENGDGVAEYLGIGSREVPGTESLANPGSVGIEYVLLMLEGDAVTEIHAPANDFSDI